jgi:folate-binding protein YgfZ
MTATSSFQGDYRVATYGVGLLDRSERGKLALTGRDVREFLHGQVTQDILGLEPGHGAYATFLTPKGKMIGDLRVLNAEGELLLDTERVTLQPLFNMIRSFKLGYDVELHKRTLESGLLSLIGPLSDDLIASIADAVPGPREHDHVAFELDGNSARAVRTDLGLDLLCAAPDYEALQTTLTRAGAATIGEEAAECLRVESGRPRYGVDLDDSVIPQEAGLNERAVSFTKGCYVGQETVARLYYRGKPNRELRGLRSPQPLPVGAELTDGQEGRVLGTVTSSALSPRLGALALALVRREAPPGAVVQVDGDQEAVVVELPFDRSAASLNPASDPTEVNRT